MRFIRLAAISLPFALSTHAAAEDPPLPAPAAMALSHARFNIAVVKDGETTFLTHSDRDFKPVSSLDGETLVFFRVMTYGDGSFETWRTAICVVGTDGGGFRQLTSGEHADYNPTFLRDGSNRIAFNRYNRTGRGHSEIFLTTIDAEPGSEQLVSHPTEPAYEWVYSSLKDGRLFIHRIRSAERAVFLLTPNPGGAGRYERVEMPSNQYFHKASIAPSETKITYMYDNDNNGATYEDAQIAWARLDVAGPRVFDQTLITPDDRRSIEEYPKWSPDETMVLYDSNKHAPGGPVQQVYAHRIADGVERNLSLDPAKNDQFPCVLGMPK